MRDSVHKGPLAEYPVVGVRIDLRDGSYHDVDSSERAFYICAQGCFRESMQKAKPVLLEPIMKVELECPESYQGDVVGDVIRRRGLIVSTDSRDAVSYVIAEVPLAETFGYATDLRSMTKGQGTFTMELLCYRKCPGNVQEEIVAKRKKKD
jgi:elongation factor G